MSGRAWGSASCMSCSERPRHTPGCMHRSGHTERQSHETGRRACSFGQTLRMVGYQSGPASGRAFARPRVDGERVETQLDRSVVLGSSRQPAGYYGRALIEDPWGGPDCSVMHQRQPPMCPAGTPWENPIASPSGSGPLPILGTSQLRRAGARPRGLPRIS